MELPQIIAYLSLHYRDKKKKKASNVLIIYILILLGKAILIPQYTVTLSKVIQEEYNELVKCKNSVQ